MIILLGKKVKCKVTGFTGIATAETKYLNGCVRYCVTPKMIKEGEMPKEAFFDVEQLEVVDEESVDVKPSATGGGSNPPSRNCI